MATFLCKTKGNADPKGKPRVYFCCHPEDFARYFDKLCEDVFKTHDCAIYYTADMTEAFDERDMDTDLGQMNLFVVPVTFRLLSQPNRAMDTDLAYAKQQNIAILPFMMESGIDAFYSTPEKFGQRQYINPYSTDTTEISYADKLKKYLEAVLISNETAQRVRDAFDAYIFLSYRKKDRRYANQLMRLIHKNPEYRDIAIWYDEFLTPGESFKQNIDKAMQQSKLFTLLVTPNLLEYVDGKPNFVMGVEYPAAKSAGMGVLPAEMVETDKAELREKYADIPDCVSVEDEPALRERLLEALDKIAKSENNNDPEHNFLIGLAYLDGIDVEVDRDRALELITSAAEADLPEAMEKLKDMYKDGIGVQLNYKKAVYWAEKLVACYENLYGEAHEITMLAINFLSLLYSSAGDYQKEKSAAQRAYDLLCKTFGEEHIYTLNALSNIATAYQHLGDFPQSLEICQRVYTLKCKAVGAEHQSTLTSLNNLAIAFGNAGDYQKARQMAEQAYRLQCKLLGEEHPSALLALNNTAAFYGSLGDYQKELELHQKAFYSRCKVLGQEHPDALSSLTDIGATYNALGEYAQAITALERSYHLHQKVLGEEHPQTLQALSALILSFYKQGDHQNAITFGKKAYSAQCKQLGAEHPETLITQNNLALSYQGAGNHAQALKMNEQIYHARCRVYGKEHHLTLISLNNVAMSYQYLGQFDKALQIGEQLYALRCKVSGEEHPLTLLALNNLALTYQSLGNHQKSLELFKKAYHTQCRVLGKEHPDTLLTLSNSAVSYRELGDHQKETEVQKEVFTSRCKVLGAEHPDTLFTQNDLGVAYNSIGDYANAVRVLKQAYELRKKVLGADHPHTQHTLKNLLTVQANEKQARLNRGCLSFLLGIFGQ